jgi:hypothetical protein
MAISLSPAETIPASRLYPKARRASRLSIPRWSSRQHKRPERCIEEVSGQIREWGSLEISEYAARSRLPTTGWRSARRSRLDRRQFVVNLHVSKSPDETLLHTSLRRVRRRGRKRCPESGSSRSSATPRRGRCRSPQRFRVHRNTRRLRREKRVGELKCVNELKWCHPMSIKNIAPYE